MFSTMDGIRAGIGDNQPQSARGRKVRLYYIGFPFCTKTREIELPNGETVTEYLKETPFFVAGERIPAPPLGQAIDVDAVLVKDLKFSAGVYDPRLGTIEGFTESEIEAQSILNAVRAGVLKPGITDLRYINTQRFNELRVGVINKEREYAEMSAEELQEHLAQLQSALAEKEPFSFDGKKKKEDK